MEPIRRMQYEMERMNQELKCTREMLERHKSVILRTAFMAGFSIAMSIIAFGICVFK